MGAPITAGTSLITSNQQAKASEGAANTQADASRYAADLTQKRWEELQAQEQPFMNVGYGATDKLSQLLGLNTGNTDSTAGDYGSLTKGFTQADYLNNQSSGYGFQLQQGTQALMNAAGAGSGSMSGSALKDLVSYNQEYAKTGYNDAFNRYQTQQNNVFNRLSSLATLGQNAASNTGAQGTQLASTQASATQNAGAAQAAGQLGAANAYAQGATNAAQASSNSANTWLSMLMGGV